MLTEEKEKIDQLIDHAEVYIKTRQRLSKMIIAEKTSTIMSSVMSGFVVFFIFFFVFVFASFSLAYFISEYFGKTYLGFISIAGLYFIIGLILSLNKDKWLKQPMMNAIIKNYFKHEEHEQN